ncbi:MAG: type I-MYXAN CRISPR-associated endonuclease Cas4/Cas1 [Candidatus Coatesbacteria bacterium]|nr:MAG: type I-MYXAN CRISPR-associated endonuclease Cas4/Cas1 [Candidatus Coatesbacteria bacterium]
MGQHTSAALKLEPLAAQEPPIRVMALRALAYCERLFYLEEVEEIYVANELVYAGRTLHEEAFRQDGLEPRSFEMSSERLGLVGKVDAVRHRDGSWVPYELKRGRPYRAKDKSPRAWPADALQVCAYGMLLEEFTHTRVKECRVRYDAEKVTVRVPLDEDARAAVLMAVHRARHLREATERPPITRDERKCVRCSLAPVCLPEEERAYEHDGWDTIRLFPAIPDGRVIHVTRHGTRIGRSGETLKIEERDVEKRVFPIHDVDCLVIHGYGQITTQALMLCAAHNIPVHWVTAGGRYVGAFSGGAGPVQRRIRQYMALSNPAVALDLARRLAHAKVEGQLRYLLRATCKHKPRTESVMSAVERIRRRLKDIAHAQSISSVRGYEGDGARAYFRALPHLLGHDVPEAMRPKGRSRRPPRDRFNALLGFGYALLNRSVLQSIIAVGLEPAFGFLHQPRTAAHPLVLDIMELFRVPVWDIPLIGSINRRQWDTEQDFSVTRDRVWLSGSGRKKAINLYERRLEDRWKHPVAGYSLSYARTIELEVRLLEKEWTLKKGLFARARLR